MATLESICYTDQKLAILSTTTKEYITVHLTSQVLKPRLSLVSKTTQYKTNKIQPSMVSNMQGTIREGKLLGLKEANLAADINTDKMHAAKGYPLNAKNVAPKCVGST